MKFNFVFHKKTLVFVHIFQYLFSFVILLFGPVYLFSLSSIWLGYSYSKNSSIFEYFGFFGSILLFLNLWIESHRDKKIFSHQKYFYLFFSLFILYQLINYSELSKIGSDYLAYEASIRALLANQSPYNSWYTANHPYIYPPLLTQILTFIFRLISWSSFHLMNIALHEEDVFHLLFYFYQVIQFCLTLVCFYLSYSIARKFRINQVSASFLIFILFIINLPLYRNFSQNQVNLWVLCSLCLSILFIEKQPTLSGLVIALGTHLKLYPIIQGFPFLLEKKWKALISLCLSLLGVFLLLTDFGKNTSLWRDFIFYLGKVEKGVALRNNSLYSLAYNLSRFFGVDQKGINISAVILNSIFIGILVIWILLRIYRRTKNRLLPHEERLIGNMIDCIYMMFFVSPSVWDHHLLMAIPAVLWVASQKPKALYGSLGLSIILIFFIPTFDIFFFSYIRLIGLILLLKITPVEKITNFHIHEEINLLPPYPIRE